MIHDASILHTAGAVVLTPQRHVLLLRAYRNWDLPKGLVEPGEVPLQAALRELREETGLAPPQVSLRWGDTALQTEPYKTRHAGKQRLKVGHFFLLQAYDASPAVALSREHHGFAWLPLGEARERVVERLQQVLEWAARSSAQA